MHLHVIPVGVWCGTQGTFPPGGMVRDELEARRSGTVTITHSREIDLTLELNQKRVNSFHGRDQLRTAGAQSLL